MVASTIITLSGPALLNKFAIGLAGEAGTWAFKQILHSASGGSDTDKIRRDISAAVTEMRELKRTVDNLSRELPEALLQLRSDNLRESLTKIETMYDTITDLMETAVTLPEDISDAERDKRLNAFQTRLEDRLRVCSDEIPGILDRINDFLVEDGPRSFLRQAVQKAFDNSDDFVSYHEKSKTSMLSCWVVVVKGISLLQMAYDAPNVEFFEGALTIQRQKEKLNRQEQTFRAVVGENTVRLIEWTLLRPFTLVTLLTDEGFGIEPKDPSIDDITSMSLFIGARIPVHRISEDLDTVKMATMWKMSFGSGFGADLRHAVRFVHYSSGKSEALTLCRDADDIETSPELDKALRWKLDLRLMPLLCFTYALQSIDKNTISYAAVFGLREDLKLKGDEFSWTGGIFYLGYLVWEFPTSMFLQRFPINYFMSGTVIAWGAVLMAHGAVTSFATLVVVRVLLGALEAAINPGTMLLFSMYYMRKEQPLRMGIWIGSAGMGYIIAGIASFGIGHVKSALPSWRVLFIIWGSITVAWGVILLFLLPGAPMRAKFLTADEKARVISRVKGNGTGIENKHFKMAQFWEAILDMKTWLLFLFALTSNSPNGGLSAFQGLIIKGAGFSTLDTTLYQMPSGAVQLVACVLACWGASVIKNSRIPIMLLGLVPFLAGVLGLHFLPHSDAYARLACLWMSFSYTATWTLSMSVSMANTAGHTKKITTNALLLIGYCLGNFVGPFFFKSNQAPQYELGVGMMFTCIAIQVASLIALWVLLWMRNRSRQDLHTPENQQRAWEAGLLDETDFKNKYFQYVY
ncbi:allantoate and ureidosuccinate permease [Fusarium sp. NRRL 25303]|nr:allantoate and ureidosuccinate permease [Fusarium sp. NRRL 25303]